MVSSSCWKFSSVMFFPGLSCWAQIFIISMNIIICSSSDGTCFCGSLLVEAPDGSFSFFSKGDSLIDEPFCCCHDDDDGLEELPAFTAGDSLDFFFGFFCFCICCCCWASWICCILTISSAICAICGFIPGSMGFIPPAGFWGIPGSDPVAIM